MKSINIFQLQT